MKKFLLLFSILTVWLISTRELEVRGQNVPPDFTWVKQAAGFAPENNNETGLAIAHDKFGNSYITGYFQGNATFGNITLAGYGGQDIFIAKYDSFGNLIWVQHAGGASDDNGNSIAVDSSGNCYITGFFQGNATFSGVTLTGSGTPAGSGSEDVFIAKYDSSGSLVWAKKAGGFNTDIGYRIAVDAAGNNYITGDFVGNISFGSTTLTSSGMLDVFVAKYDPAGNVLWARKAGNSSSFNDNSRGIGVDSSGNCYISGYFVMNITFGSTTLTSNDQDIFIAKYDSQGSVLWAKQAGGTNFQFVRSFTVDPSGNSYVSGYFNGAISVGTTSLNSSGAHDAFIAKFDAIGNGLWVQKAGGPNDDFLQDIAVDPSGNVYTTGTFSGSVSLGSHILTGSGGQDVFIAKFTSSGSVLWVKKAGGTGNEIGQSISADASGNCYFTGGFASKGINFGSTSLSSKGGTDIFIAKYNAVGDEVWVKSPGFGFGYVVSNKGQAIAVDPSGNSYTTGLFTGNITFGNTTLEGNGGQEVFITKHDPAGNLTWAQKAGGTGNDVSTGIAIDASGNSYITGHFSGTATFGTITLTSSGQLDIFVAKYDIAGNLVWAKKGGGTSEDISNSIAADANGNVYITGYFNGSAVFGSASLTGSNGSQDIFIVKYDGAGNVLWAKKAGGADYDEGNNIGIDASGNCYVTGYIKGNAIFGTTTLSTADTDIFLAKYSPAGNVIWAKKAGGSSTDFGHSLSIDASGSCYVSGYFVGKGTFGSITLNGSSNGNLFIARYDASGNVQWAKQINGVVSANRGSSIKADSTGNCFITGQFGISAAFDGYTLTTAVGQYDAFIAKYDALGNVVWAQKAGGTMEENSQGIAVDKIGNCYITGYFKGNSFFGNTSLLTYGTEVFFAKVQANGIAVTNLPVSSLCPGGTTNISFATSGAFNTGNIFTAELSDASGSFISPVNIGTLAGSGSGILNTSIPANTLAGTGYRIRIIASSPATTGVIYNSNITIMNRLAAPIASASQNNITQGESVTLSVANPDPNLTYSWNGPGLVNQNGTTINITPSVLGINTYTVSAQASANHCSPLDADSIDITVTPPVISWTGGTSSAWNVAGNWSSNSVPTATRDVIIPAGAGRYPAISSGTATAKDLTIASGASLTISGGTLEVKESFINNGTITTTGGSVIFSGSVMQIIGGANPSTFHDLTISSAGASLAGPVSVQRMLTLNGNLNTNGNTFTLLSNASGTAMVVNAGGVVNGTAKVQRYIDPSLNLGTGYRHFASPVTSTTISDLATGGFTPVVNPAYNTAAKPGTVRPFPTVFQYNQSRLTNDSAATMDFGFGWESPASLSSALTPGKGYSVNIPASQTVDFTGTLNNGNVTVPGLGRGATTESGWHLLGNPYPAPIDWDNITIPSGMMDAVYAFRSSSAYNGSYAAYVNGVGSLTGGVIPAMQAFFVRTTAPVASFSFTNAARLTSYQNPSFHRSTETRPLLQLSASKGQQQDEAYLYLEQGATAAMDNSFDAFSLPMGAIRVYTLVGTSQLSINGLGYSAAPQLVPLVVEGAAGTYSLKVEQLLNQFQVQLEDKQLNTMQLLTPTTIYSFSHAGGSTANRFVLHVGARISGVAEAAKGMEVKLYPNPSNGKFQLQLSGLKAASADMIITDLAGKVVMQKQVKASNDSILENIELKAAKGIYLLQIKADQQVITWKMVIE
ncbi:SBBP repeat-containing protein [Adhaeribacter soli]|uniref:T9SS type A sorting domain-containing protein n=1 Tax=Adhaeribacter soli TaxID=2607655 RepID=A0A5N1IK30_9BACT|nr:SBBP repeat-containing protein [Adhaeribacter soli]KAA9325004.1 T9SS type A sorting domain-containing protein [Adhaeribacter soli]